MDEGRGAAVVGGVDVGAGREEQPEEPEWEVDNRFVLQLRPSIPLNIPYSADGSNRKKNDCVLSTDERRRRNLGMEVDNTFARQLLYLSFTVPTQ